MKYYLASSDLYIKIQTSVFNQIQLQAEGEYPNETEECSQDDILQIGIRYI